MLTYKSRWPARLRAVAVAFLFCFMSTAMLIAGGEFFGVWLLAGGFVALGGICAYQEWKS